MLVRVGVHEREIGRIAVGNPATVTLDALRWLHEGDVRDIFAGTHMAPAQRWWPRGAYGQTLSALERRRFIVRRVFGEGTASQRDSYEITELGESTLADTEGK